MFQLGMKVNIVVIGDDIVETFPGYTIHRMYQNGKIKVAGPDGIAEDVLYDKAGFAILKGNKIQMLESYIEPSEEL